MLAPRAGQGEKDRRNPQKYTKPIFFSQTCRLQLKKSCPWHTQSMMLWFEKKAR
jgi:hypothetical protein